ncbi:hypothetical protein [Candidatus Palauibacter sp.]|uniref:hypothetical protein n=1 Tax=Candidatus Palauibacter sp. TaxID=3101350 RepID=UPI003B0264AF
MRSGYAVFIGMLAACGGEPGGGSAPPAREDRPLEADFEEVYRIGGIAAEGWDAFTEIADLDFDADGRLYIRDEAGPSTRILVVNGVGGLVAEFGRMGDGPGELRDVGQMVARPGGGAVIVDNGHGAYLLFGPDGSFERALRFADTGASRTVSAQIVRVAREGGALFLIRNAGASLSQGAASISAGDRTIYRILLDEGEEAVPEPFAEGWEPRPEREVTIEAEDPTALFGALADAFAFFEPRLVFDVLPGGAVAYSDSSAYAIRIQAAGAPSRVVGRPLHPEPVTEQMRQRVRARALENMESSMEMQVDGSPVGDDVPEAFRQQMATMMEDLMAGMRDMVENAAFMSEVPLVRDLRTTWEGEIWVQRWGSDPLAQVEFAGGGPAGGGPEGEEAATGWIDVLSAEGEYVGTLSLEETAMPDAFGPGGLVAFVETEEFDVPTIILKRLPEAVQWELGSTAPGAEGGGR